MAEMNGSEELNNGTNQTLHVPICTTGSWPSKPVEITSYSVLLFLSLIGNFLVVAVFYKNKKLRTPVHYFITNMAVSDLVIPVVVLPWFTSLAYNDYLWLEGGLLPSVLCKIVPFAWHLSISVSTCSMVAIAVDRFHAVLFAMKQALISRKTCRLVIVATWIFSVALRAPNFYGYRLVHYDNGFFCQFQWGSPSQDIKVRKTFWILITCLSFLPTAVITVMYTSIAIFLYRQKPSFHLASEVVQKRARRNRKIICMLAIVVALFFAMLFPNTVMIFVFSFRPNIELPCFFIWLSDILLLVLCPAINPVIYYVFNENYRQGFKELLRCPWSCSNYCFQISSLPQGMSNASNTGQESHAVENIELNSKTNINMRA